MPSTRCLCLSGQTYDACCGRLHSGMMSAATAEQLMRSRFAAFAIGDTNYLLATWHPLTRPVSLQLDSHIRWYRLDVVSTSAGGVLDDEGIVGFRAHYREAAGSVDRLSGVQEETSRFRRVSGVWFYLDALS